MALAILGAAACQSTPDLPTKAASILTSAASPDSTKLGLTGVWLDEFDERVLFVQAGSSVAIMPLGDALRQQLHFGEGRLAGSDLQLVRYRHGVSSEVSTGGVDVPGTVSATVGADLQSLEVEGGGRWRRTTSFPGTGATVGIWRASSGGRFALAHEGRRALACAIDPEAASRHSVAFAQQDESGRLWSIFLRDGRPDERAVGTLDEKGTAIAWSNGDQWKLDEPLAGAPPGPPALLVPQDQDLVPNSVDRTLTWSFDWSDVAGASEYRIEVLQERARRPFIQRDGLTSSELTHVAEGGVITRTEGWSWRVAAKVGGAWTTWSDRALFSVEEP